MCNGCCYRCLCHCLSAMLLSLPAAPACLMWSIGVVFPTFRVGHVYGHLFMDFLLLYAVCTCFCCPSSFPPRSVTPLRLTRTMDSLHVISTLSLLPLACVRFPTAMCVQDQSQLSVCCSCSQPTIITAATTSAAATTITNLVATSEQSRQ